MLRKLQSLSFLFLLLVIPVVCQQTPSAPADTEARIDSMVKQLTLVDKIDLIGGVDDFYIRANQKIGLPRLKMSDGPVGLRNYGASTALAGGIALAATWDLDLIHRAGIVLGDDARARGVHFLLGPGVNIYRAPMNGRNFEYFGEDPFLASRVAVAYINGVQSRGVCATIKHFVGNNSEYDRHNVDSIIDERTLREIYLPSFEAAVKEAHVCSVMDSYNFTNGEHMSQNGYLNNDVVKKEWGFKGILMSDWTSTYDGVAAVNGGLDLEMPSGKFMNRATLSPAVKAGKVSEATIDDHVRRILRIAIQMSWLERDQTQLFIPRYNLDGRAVSLDAARASIVLLKNEGDLLPLDKTRIKTIAVVGPDAYPAVPVGGGSAAVRPFNAVSYLEGLANYSAKIKVLYDPGIPSLSEMAQQTPFLTESSGGVAGLKVELFASTDLSGVPNVKGRDEDVNYSEEIPLPASFNSGRWTGYYVAGKSAPYHVFVQSMWEQGGVRLYLDEHLIVDDWQRHTALVNDVTLNLTPGPHKVRLEAYRTDSWNSPHLRLGIVAATSLVNSEARAIASSADAVVVAVGFDRYSESEGSDRSFQLPTGQDELIEAMLAANKNVIVVVNAGGAVDMSAWLNRTPALLQAWYPGQEGGTALAQILFGDFSPSGKLPVSFDRRLEDNPTYPNYYPNDGDKRVKYNEGIFVGYRYHDKMGVKPLFPFGFGLSYTTFKFADLAITPSSTTGDQPVTVSFNVTNTGNREGAEVAELYVSDHHANVPRPVKELKGFAKVNLKPGETQKISITLDRRALSYYDSEARQWKASAGEFGVMVGTSAAEIVLHGALSLTR
ncbi:MAG TPA: glycoside hydrolase family 3 C-terminal domain-containing protein [Candidatus Sulfotelmatobacter sp.]|nr:glycoside hydrolase family 3 C-terminal domain-containing protein [Candidatus Sulfotelmatobacter sp.]